jgi:hypothetical protein
MRYSCNLVFIQPIPGREMLFGGRNEFKARSNTKHHPILTPTPETIPQTRPSCHNAVVVQTKEQDRSHEVCLIVGLGFLVVRILLYGVVVDAPAILGRWPA